MEFDNNNPNILTLDLPVKDSKGISGLFLRYYSTLGMLICDFKSDTDYRLDLFTNLMIASIPEDDKRDMLKQMKKELTKERLAGIQNPSVEDVAKAAIHSSLEVIGEISGYMDLYFGTSKKIGVSIEAIYPDGYFNGEEDGEVEVDA